MSACIICKRKIEADSHWLIKSHGVEMNFYSQNCAKKYIEIEERYLNGIIVVDSQIKIKKNENPDIYIAVSQEDVWGSE